MVVNILQNITKIYFNHNSNIKYLDSTIKYIGFESFRYNINMDVISSFMFFNGFNSMFPSMHS